MHYIGIYANLPFLYDRALEQRSRRDTTGELLRTALRVFLVSMNSRRYGILGFCLKKLEMSSFLIRVRFLKNGFSKMCGDFG